MGGARIADRNRFLCQGDGIAAFAWRSNSNPSAFSFRTTWEYENPASRPKEAQKVCRCRFCSDFKSFKMDCSRSVVGLVISSGMSFNMDGTIYICTRFLYLVYLP